MATTFMPAAYLNPTASARTPLGPKFQCLPQNWYASQVDVLFCLRAGMEINLNFPTTSLSIVFLVLICLYCLNSSELRRSTVPCRPPQSALSARLSSRHMWINHDLAGTFQIYSPMNVLIQRVSYKLTFLIVTMSVRHNY